MFESKRHAIAILKKDHQQLKDLFDEFENAEKLQQKQRIAKTIVKELKAHAAVEEEMFYPAVRAAVGGKIMNEADVEHHVAKLLVAEIENMDGTEGHFDAKVHVLAESVRHHIKEEENDMMPKAKSADIDFEILGDRLLARKEQLFRNGFPELPEERLMAQKRSKSSDSVRKPKTARGKKTKSAAVYARNSHAHGATTRH